MSRGLGRLGDSSNTGPVLRQNLNTWLGHNGGTALGGQTIGLWVQWETGLNLPAYIRSLSPPNARYGGALEVIMLSRIHAVVVCVFHRPTNASPIQLWWCAHDDPQGAAVGHRIIYLYYNGHHHCEYISQTSGPGALLAPTPSRSPAPRKATVNARSSAVVLEPFDGSKKSFKNRPGEWFRGPCF